MGIAGLLRKTAGLLAPLALAAACGSPAADDAVAAAADEQVLPLAQLGTASGEGTVHLVRVGQEGVRYRFAPAELTIRQGDILRFVQTGRQPETIVWDAAPGAVPGLEQAQSPVLVDPGDVWEVNFGEVPPGRYGFYSLPHRSFGMEGAVIVRSSAAD